MLEVGPMKQMIAKLRDITACHECGMAITTRALISAGTCDICAALILKVLGEEAAQVITSRLTLDGPGQRHLRIYQETIRSLFGIRSQNV